MIIVVEGIDRVGKTTICDKLSNELNIPIYKYNGILDYKKMENNQETDKMLQILEMCKITNSDIIFDRFYWTDYVYGNIERCYDTFESSKNITRIEEKLKELDAIIIYVKPTDIKKSSIQHGKDLFQYDKLMDLCYNMCELKKIRCDYNSIDKIVKEIRKEIKL